MSNMQRLQAAYRDVPRVSRVVAPFYKKQTDPEFCQVSLKTSFYCAVSFSWSANSPRSGAEEVHGGGKGGLKTPGGAGAAAVDTEGGGGDPRVCSASSQGVVCMEGPGQTGKTPLSHHPQLWEETHRETQISTTNSSNHGYTQSLGKATYCSKAELSLAPPLPPLTPKQNCPLLPLFSSTSSSSSSSFSSSSSSSSSVKLQILQCCKHPWVMMSQSKEKADTEPENKTRICHQVVERQRHKGGAAHCCMQAAHSLRMNGRVDVGVPGQSTGYSSLVLARYYW
ncbi:hypothetical protein FQN60_012786 [Etheostoma spectabile]|uniref:Uncharacterized protein n=1 Tax=Etheostoma spectabile TaxID=54343 RepID=A0A5J5DC29_9PERO|nr:hypothetical protein FQN60_012786 [Etheostoma spectabile]